MPLSTWDAGIATTNTSCDGGSLATPTAPQTTGADPNRCGEPMSRPKGAHALQGVEEVRNIKLSEPIKLIP
ncbi:MAG: hypothetical protein QW604_01210 [Fervidicoccaceae archaeon]